MLKLHRLELSGFKSFVDPVTVEFAGGVTGIVGPNGCGKSNLSDAVSWVLGEQSAKTLRGETMEDVIFNGSEQRRPLGMGEATVTFHTDLGFPHAEEGRLTIARRVFRSGESQYRLNGKLVRLKEIKDLLMDTGLGIRAYSVIEQGKIGMILSGKPQERRKLIEEAAGVTRYKARKRIAEVKLEEATANLLRLDDIISEVERNVRSLKRQAGAARRYQEKHGEYRRLQREVLLARWASLNRDLVALRLRLVAAQSEEAELGAAVHREEADLALHRERLEQQAQALAERTRRQAALIGTIEGRQEFLRGGRRTLDEIASRVTAGEALAERRRHELAEHGTAAAELEQRRAAAAAEHDELALAVAADDRALAAAQQAVAATEQRMEVLRTELMSSVGQVTALRNRLNREQMEGEKGSFRQHHLAEESSQRATEAAEASAALAAAETRLRELEVALAAKSAELAAAQAGLEELLQLENGATQRLRSVDSELAAARQRQRFLAELAAGAAESRDSLRERLAAAGIADPVFLAERLTARKGWEKSLDLFLGELTEAVLLPGTASALTAAERLAANGRGAASLLTGVDDSEQVAWPTCDDAAIVAPLAEALGLPAELGRALPPAYLVATPADAERLARRHPGVAFLSRQRLWAEGGLVRVAGEEAQPGLLTRESERLDLTAKLPLLETELGRLQEELRDLVETRTRAAQAIHTLRDEISHLKQESAVAATRREEAGQRHRRLALAEQTLRTEQEEVGRELARLQASQSELTTALAAAEAVHKTCEQRFDKAQADVEVARQERESRRAAGAGRRGERDVLAERLRGLDQEQARFAREIQAASRQLEAWAVEARALADKREELETAMSRAERELQEALELAAGEEDRVRAESERLEGERQATRGREESVQALRSAHDTARSGVEELRIALTGAEHDAGHVGGLYGEEFGEPLPEAGTIEPLADLSAREEELARLKSQIEAIGPVNVLAAQEHTEQEERHTFLIAQRADVHKSVDSLRTTIREINQTSSERFKVAFAEVNANFSKTFADLFRGGEAEMRLLDEEDLLESGIEIVARPPGKRLQNLMLLSGGEKALTAIALLFALFRTKPSPFCILDEVDAPLDDVNTMRFVGMLRELSRETQCIVITHNKLTMEVAATLYGVTMEERGVSKLVTVALEDVQPEAAAATA